MFLGFADHPEFPGSSCPQSSATIQIQLCPDDTVVTGATYRGKTGYAIQRGALNTDFTFLATTHASGDLQLAVSDEYTYYQPTRPGVFGATVTVTDAFDGSPCTRVDGSPVLDAVTNGAGVARISGLREGYYNVEIGADGHRSDSGVVYVAPGTTTDFPAFLQVEGVTYSWVVWPTDIEDQYEITLESTLTGCLRP